MTSTKTFNGDLVLTKDTKFDCNIVVKGNIICKGRRWNIDAWNIDAWNINALNIDALNINAGDIDAWNIDAWNINALNIDAGDIDAGDIICVSRKKKKSKDAKTIAYSIILNRFKRERKEVMGESK